MSGVRFISRPEAFELAPAVAAFLADWQRSHFVLEEHLVEEGTEVWIDDEEGAKALTAEDAAKWNDDIRQDFDAWLDPLDVPAHSAVPQEEIIAEPDCRSMRGIGGATKRHMSNLAKELGAMELMVMPTVRCSILCQENDHPPVRRATEKLAATGFDRSDRMVAVGPTETVAKLLGSLFWIARCNASAPYILLSMPGAPLTGILCKYGNIHFTALDRREEMIGALERSGFLLPRDGMCKVRFQSGSGLSGRKISL